MRSHLLVLLVLVLVLIGSFAIYTHAGWLDGDREITSSGTRFTAEWWQGCYQSALGGIGPNSCHSAQPWYCPLDSEGSDDYVERADLCGCPPNHEPQADNSCLQCIHPCDDNPCEDYESCSAVGDWCDDNYQCTCDIQDASEGCAIFASCGSGETCEFSGGDLCNPNNYECIEDSEPVCDCTGNVVCYYTHEDPEEESCSGMFSHSASCEPIYSSSNEQYYCGTTMEQCPQPWEGCVYTGTTNECDPIWLGEC